MADDNVHPSDPPSAPESQSKQPTQPEATLQDVLDTMHDSDFFPRTGKDAPSRFWSAYERVAKQHDDEFIERHNGEMDVLLIFAGLFSAVSSTFIVNMQSSLMPSASDTTNALLKILVNKIDNTTFPPQEAALPVWTGPSSTTIWIQTLAYASLSSSLLAAFGAVLGKQWLGHFKTSRFGRGALHERCKRRQQKLDALESSHFSTILATLPILLQLSLLFFGIALAGNIWTLQHTVASVIMAPTAFGLIFYFFTLVSSLKSSDCPFQTPVSTVLQQVLQYLASFRTEVRNTWQGRPKTWRGFLDRLRETSRRAVYIGRALRHNFRSAVNDPEAAGVVDHSISETAGEHAASSKKLDFSDILDPPIEILRSQLTQSRAVQWIIETSTDIDNIAAAAGMVLEIEWLAAEDVTNMLERLKGHFYACFDPTQHILPLAQARAVAYLKAISYCSVEQSRDNPFKIYSHGYIKFEYDFSMTPDQSFLAVVCALGYPGELDMISLPLSDRMWMAHMFTYRLHGDGDDTYPEFVSLLIKFIDTCLDPKSPVRLAADCVLLAGMLLGLQVDRRRLAWLDKSVAINGLRSQVLDHMLDVLIDEIPGRKDTALKLFHPLFQYHDSHGDMMEHIEMMERVIKFCFHLLGEDPDTARGGGQVRSRNLALLIPFIVRNDFIATRKSFTTAQFDSLMDYHLYICEGTDYNLIKHTFQLLEFGSPNYPKRMRRYIDTIIRFMGEETTRIYALRAAPAIRAEIASMTQDDESLREDFSKALASVVLLDPMRTTLADNPFTKISFFNWLRDEAYFQLLCTLAQDPIWHFQLHQNGHFDNCLVIAKTLFSQNDDFGCYLPPVAHIFALMDGWVDETYPLFNTVRAYPRRPLVLRAWKHIFNTYFFRTPAVYSWGKLSSSGYLDSLPSLVGYAREQFNDDDEPLIALVEQMCRKLTEEKQRREQGDTQHVHDRSVWYKEISVLGNHIRALLDASLKDV